MAAAHIDKRPNLSAGPTHTYYATQTSITSFFNPAHTTSQCSTSSYNTLSFSQTSSCSTPPAISIPALPASIQSNLLNVGMRIRKSIPEGHKTGSPHNAFSLFSESPVSPRTIPALCQPTNTSSHYASINAAMATSAPGLGVDNLNVNGKYLSQANQPPPSPNSERKLGRARARELTPFCGLLKVGGWSMQSEHSSMATEIAADDVPPLSSQSSTTTVDSMSVYNGVESGYCSWDGSAWTPAMEVGLGAQLHAASNKRRWDDENDENEACGVSNSVSRADRTFKVPRKMKKEAGLAHATYKTSGQRDGEADFEEAPFLDYAHAIGGEVEMGGV